MDCSMPGFPVLHYLPEFAQIHVHGVGDAIQPSHPLAPSPPAFNLFQHQGLFQWVGSLNIQYWFPLGLTGLISLLSKGLSRVFSSTTIWKHQFFDELSHQYITIGKTITLTMRIFVGKVMSLHFNTLSRFIIAFLPSSKCLLISWLQSPDYPWWFWTSLMSTIWKQFNKHQWKIIFWQE